MSIIAKFLTAVTEPQFKLARDLTAMAIADGEITSEEKEASHTERLQDEEASRELLRRNLERATETFMENRIIMKEFKDMNLDFQRILKEEEFKTFKRYGLVLSLQ